MKPLKIILSVILLLVVAGLAYAWFNREEWQTRKRCADCEALEDQKQQRLIGTVAIVPNGKIVFTHQRTGLTYNLIPCDLKCDNYLNQWFGNMGVVDDNNQPVLFDIEGSFNASHQDFVYSSAILLDTRKFINVSETKGLTFNEIRERYTTVNEETFPLNENYGEFRGALDAFFTEEQRQQPIPIKEATWETSDSTLLTIWYIEKQGQWQPIEQYEWKKGTEF